MSGYLPDGCTQEDLDRAAGGYDEPDEPEECHHGVSFNEECEDCEEENDKEEPDDSEIQEGI